MLLSVGHKIGPESMILDFLGIKDYSESLANVFQYAFIVTNQRCIFARLTKQMFKEELDRSRQKAKEEGKEFFGQWKASHPTRAVELSGYVLKY